MPTTFASNHSFQKTLHSLVSVFVLLLLSTKTLSEQVNTKENESPSHDFISCSIISSEHLTTLQLYQRGVPLKTALESLPGISREAKKRVTYIYELATNIGILNAYADINTNYARCANLVFKKIGKPFIDEPGYGYYFCAGENKRRYEILLNTDRYMNLDKVIAKTPDTHIDVAISYYKLIEGKGLLAAFDFTANNLKACLNNLRPTQK